MAMDGGLVPSVALVPASKMPSLIPKPLETTSDSSHLLPPFLRLNSKIIFEHEGQFHKFYLTKSPEGTFCYSYYKSHVNKKYPDWSVPLLDRGSGPKNVKFSNGTYIESDTPESINR
jgi:hypothetical protein